MPSLGAIGNGILRAVTCGSVNRNNEAGVDIAHGAGRGPQPTNPARERWRRFIDAIQCRPGNQPDDTPTQPNDPVNVPQLPPLAQINVSFPDFDAYGEELAENTQQSGNSFSDPIREIGERARRTTPEPIIRPPVVLSTAVSASGSFIENDTKVPLGLRALLRTQLRNAEKLLASGPVILGEDHTKPAARAVLMDLMLRGTVKNLFLELGSLEGDMFDNYQGGHGKNVSDHLRENARGQASLVDDPLWTEELSPHLALLDRQHGNPIGMVELMEIAVANGVLLHFSDNAVTRRPASEEGMQMRNQATGAFFIEREGNQPGSVILIGGAHTEKRSIGGSQDTSIQAYVGVSANRVMDLSGAAFRQNHRTA